MSEDLGMAATVQIFVYMPDEAVDTWRPVEASSLPLESIGSCHPTPIRTAKYGNSVPASSFAVRSERFKEDRLVSLPPAEPSRPTIIGIGAGRRAGPCERRAVLRRLLNASDVRRPDNLFSEPAFHDPSIFCHTDDTCAGCGGGLREADTAPSTAAAV